MPFKEVKELVMKTNVPLWMLLGQLDDCTDLDALNLMGRQLLSVVRCRDMLSCLHAVFGSRSGG